MKSISFSGMRSISLSWPTNANTIASFVTTTLRFCHDLFTITYVSFYLSLEYEARRTLYRFKRTSIACDEMFQYLNTFLA